MKLPAVWIVAAFVSGALVSTRWPQPVHVWVVPAVTALLLGGILSWRVRITSAWICALISWAALGGLAASVERAAVPANHVTHLIAAGRLDTTDPLRWRGHLSEDPMDLPWGRRYEIQLESVEITGTSVPVSGGLRMNLYGAEHVSSAPQGLRAGDRVEALVKARPPRNFLDPGAFDLRGFLARQGVDLTGSLRSGELLQLIDRPPPTFSQRFARARGTLLSRLDALFSAQPERAAVLRAMLLGDRSFVDSAVVTSFQKTAAYHALVVAGLHVGALVVFLFWLCRRLRLSIALTSLVTIAGLVAYVGVVEDRPPILRAALMAVLYLCARPLFRRVELLNTVAVAALVILIWRPPSLSDSSFQLSFVAAAAIAGLALPWMDRTSAPYRAGLRHLSDVTRDNAHPPRVAQFRIDARTLAGAISAKLPAWLAPRANSFVTAPVRAGLRLWEIVLLSFVIQWGMMPLLALDFHRVSLAGPLSNVPAVILTGLIVPLGFLALAATFVWTRLAVVLAKVLGFCAGMLLATVNWFSRLPRVSYRIPSPPLWLLLVFFAAFVCLMIAARLAASKRSSRMARRQLPPPAAPMEWGSALVLLVLAVIIAWYPFRPQIDRGRLEVCVLDVGQGDSVFAAFPDGRTMLIDGGGLAGSEWVGGHRSGSDVGEQVVSPYLWSRGLKRIDVVVLTHADHDHLDGLHAVLGNFRVGELWVGREEDRPAFRQLIAEAHSQAVRVKRETQGANFDWDGARADVLSPPENGIGEESSNDNSLVLRLTDGNEHFLLTGDIGRRAEEALVEEHAPLAAQFVKVPHHGSKTSSTNVFLAAVAPQVAVASVGESNPFGHPAQEVVDRYKSAGARFLRTDRDGVVTAITDGQNLVVHSYVEQ